MLGIGEVLLLLLLFVVGGELGMRVVVVLPLLILGVGERLLIVLSLLASVLLDDGKGKGEVAFDSFFLFLLSNMDGGAL